MENPRTNEKVIRLVSTALNCPVTLESSRTGSPGWDSLKHIEIVFLLEDEFGVKFTEAQIASFNSVGDLVRAVGP